MRRIPPIPLSFQRSPPTKESNKFRRPPPNPFARNEKVVELLRTPTWSVKSMLPKHSSSSSSPLKQQQQEQKQNLPSEKVANADEITPEQLHHLLRLSALPQPKNTQEESSMLRTLQTQLHFVREIQKVDTTGVQPLVSIRDETAEAKTENTIGLEDMREHLNDEEQVGKHGRLRRIPKKDDPVSKRAEDWDLFGMAEGKTTGRFFEVKKPSGQG